MENKSVHEVNEKVLSNLPWNVFFNRLFELSSDAVLVMKNDIILMANPSTPALFRTPLSLIIGRSVVDLSPEFQPDGTSSRELAFQYIQKALNGEKVSFEWMHSSLDKTYLFLTRVALNKVEIENDTFILAIVHDITQAKKHVEIIETQNTLLQIINKYALLFNSTHRDDFYPLALDFFKELFPDCFIILSRFDNEKKVFQCKTFNLDVDRVVSRILKKQLDRIEIPVKDDDLFRLKQVKISPPLNLSEITFGFISPWQEFVFNLLTGFKKFMSGWFIVEDTLFGSVVLGLRENQSIDASIFETAVNLVASVLAKKEYEIKLYQSNKERDLIFEHLPLLLAIYDINSLTFTYANPIVKNMLGYEPEEVVGKNIFSFIYQEDLLTIQAKVEKRIKQQGWLQYSYEVRFLTKSNEIRWGLITGVPIHYKGQASILVAIADTTTLHELQEKLMSIEREKRQLVELELEKAKKELIQATQLAILGRLSSTIAHEMRNPLSIIGNAVYLLEKKCQGDKKIKKYIDIIHEELKHANDVINEILEFTRLKDPVKTSVDLQATLDLIFERYFNAHNIKYSLHLLPEPFIIMADPRQLVMLFANLIKNSVESKPEGVRIVISGKKIGNEAIIHFCDNGPGIPDDIREHLFEPLYTTKTKGTGLGLFLCKMIVERHGGSIQLLSHEKGTCFEIKFPYHA